MFWGYFCPVPHFIPPVLTSCEGDPDSLTMADGELFEVHVRAVEARGLRRVIVSRGCEKGGSTHTPGERVRPRRRVRG